jgi:hypothetical protein
VETFRSLHLQKNLGDVQEAARKAPVLFLHHGQPKSVMMSVDEFRRLKAAAGEKLPAEVELSRPVVQRGLPIDPLGYDTVDLHAFARAMADAARSGRHEAAVRAEIERAERRLGMPRRADSMAREGDPQTERRARLLIPDTTPLSLLALIGERALEWLFIPGAQVWITDMVREEILRDPDPGSDPRQAHRAAIRAWLTRNGERIGIQATEAGEEYRKAMEAWDLAGRPPHLKPSWKGRGDASVLQVLDAATRIIAAGEAVVAIVDDRKLRAAIRLEERIDIDLMATESFIVWIAERFAVEEARTAWAAIEAAAGGRAPAAPEEDPVHVRPARG